MAGNASSTLARTFSSRMMATGWGTATQCRGAYAEILADIVKSLEERLGEDGQGRDARAFELDLIDGEPCGTGPAVPGRRDGQIRAQFEERPRRGLGFGQILGDAAEGGAPFHTP